MPGDQNSAKETVACSLCQSGPLEKVVFVTHVLGKRHQKNYKNLKNTSKVLRKDEAKRTLYVSGYDKRTAIETLVGVFWKYGIMNVTSFDNYSFIELAERQNVKDALGVRHFIGDQRLKVSERHQNAATESSPLRLSWKVMNALSKPFISSQNQWNTIIMLVNQIELQGADYEKREFLRQQMVQFLTPHFPRVSAFVFGSSANNLGFEGCDVDLYVNLGVDPWAEGTKAEMERKASDLTWYIARELRRTRRGLKVQAICRARVPIVKFEDPVTKLQVDLSFRHGMPVYNTQLICQYTRAHLLVRPYLMVIRYWAKVQEVAGGGQPTYLITNYALTMMMLFYLMVRHHPIIPSVALLKSQCPVDYSGEHTVAGWDCSFGQDISEWANRRHSETVMELVQEFFCYYANLDAKKWVISPLAGHLLDKESVKQKMLQKLPPCMQKYCQQEIDIQADTALCVQDPFEHSFNITRGLQEGPLAEFQYKCKKASEISEDIVKGRKPLETLFEEIYMDNEVLNAIHQCNSPKEVDISQEIITLDDSDETSQDEIEVLDLGEKKDIQEKKTDESSSTSTSNVSVSRVDRASSSSEASDSKSNGQKNNKEDFLVIKLTDGEEIEIDNKTDDILVELVSSTESETEIVVNGVYDLQETEEDSVCIMGTPENKSFKFPLDFSTTREFTITFDGSISGGKELMTSESDIGQAACSLVHFILQQCLKIDVSTVESVARGRKRKCEESADSESAKRLKNADGDSVQVVMTHKKVVEYRCTAETQLWIGRRKISKCVPLSKNHNPLQYEMAVTEAQMSNRDSALIDESGKLDFTVTVWQKMDNPASILVTGDSKSNEKVTKSMMMPMFLYLSSLTPNLLRKVVLYIVTTSSKR